MHEYNTYRLKGVTFSFCYYHFHEALEENKLLFVLYIDCIECNQS